MSPKLNPYNQVPAFNQSLADHLKSAGWLTYTEIPLGAAQSEEGIGRADVLALKKSYNVRIVVYECKVSRGDFFHDIESGKYEKYFERAHQVYFAVPSGLVKLSEVPAGVGLITRNETGWHSQRAARVHHVEVNVKLLLQCLFREQEEKPAVRALRDRVRWEDNVELSDRAHNLGYKIREKIRSVESEWQQIREAEQELAELIGVDLNSNPQINGFGLKYRVKEYVSKLKKVDELPSALELAYIMSVLLNSDGFQRKQLSQRLIKLAEQVQVNNPSETH